MRMRSKVSLSKYQGPIRLKTVKIRDIKHSLTSDDLYLRRKQVRYEALHRTRLHHLDLTARLGLPEGLEL